MKKNLKTLSFFASLLFAACDSGNNSKNIEVETKKNREETSVKHGEYLVNAMGCDDCHSPKKMGPMGPEIIEELRFSGYPANRTPPKIDRTNLMNNWVLFAPDLTTAIGLWGQSFAANISSDATGIGNWTEENFLNALKKGKYKGMEGSRTLLPPMPWMVYKNLTDDDIKSIFAYLKTTNPVSNIVPAPIAPNNIN